MELKPSNQNYLVGIMYNHSFYYAIAPKSLLVLDLTKLNKTLLNYLLNTPNFSYCRANCLTLSTKTQKAEFFNKLKLYEVWPEKLSRDLSQLIKHNNPNALNYCPTLLIDLNTQIVFASDALNELQQYLPKDFNFKKQNFLEFIPSKFQFWKKI